MKWEMGVPSPTHHSTTNWSMEEIKNTKWTPSENKMFENALALYDKDTPDRWHKVAALIPGKTVGDVIKQYEELEVDVSNIEAGLVPIPGYNTCSTFTLDWVDNYSHDGFKQSYTFGGKRSSSGRPVDQERKKGVPWTEEEHKLFLMGLKKYGKGDWRNISRNFVVTRTPTQVASHAQKYFIRQLSGGKDKRRASIHDITTVDPNEIRTPSPENKKQQSPDPSSVLSHQSDDVSMPRTHFQWNQTSGSAATMAFHSTHGNMFMSSPYTIGSYGYKVQDHDLQRGSLQESYIEPQNLAFQMQSARQYPHG